MSIRLKILAHAPATDFAFGVSLFNADGVCCYGTNTFIEQMDPQSLNGDLRCVGSAFTDTRAKRLRGNAVLK
jgi:lipopolysaccharide transport system ATP-binding protein